MNRSDARLPLAGAILVGGRSRRMGENKALLKLDPDGSSIMESAIETIRPIVDDLFLVGTPEEDYLRFGLPIVADKVTGKGPLAGIHAALLHSHLDHMMVVACDMPFLNQSLLQYMATIERNFDVLVPVVDRMQPLHAIYSRSCIPLIEEALNSGSPKVIGWFEHANVQTIDSETLEVFDPELRSTFNMNTPENLEEARKVKFRGSSRR